MQQKNTFVGSCCGNEGPSPNAITGNGNGSEKDSLHRGLDSLHLPTLPCETGKTITFSVNFKLSKVFHI